MALANEFRTDATRIQSIQLRECEYLCSVGECGIYKKKLTGEHYISKVTRKERYYDGYGIRLTMWQHDYGLLKLFYLENKILFESY